MENSNNVILYQLHCALLKVAKQSGNVSKSLSIITKCPKRINNGCPVCSTCTPDCGNLKYHEGVLAEYERAKAAVFDLVAPNLGKLVECLAEDQRARDTYILSFADWQKQMYGRVDMHTTDRLSKWGLLERAKKEIGAEYFI